MKKILFIISLILVVLVFGDFRTSGYRTARNPRGTYNFEKTITDSTIINNYFLAGDTTTAGGGLKRIDNRITVWRDTMVWGAWDRIFTSYLPNQVRLFLQDQDEGHHFRLATCRQFVISGAVGSNSFDSTGTVIFDGKWYPLFDTISTGGDAPMVGVSTRRFKESHILWQYQTDASQADTSKRWMGADTLYHESENPNKFDNDVFVDGSLKIKVGAIIDSVKVVGNNLEFYVGGTAYQASVKP